MKSAYSLMRFIAQDDLQLIGCYVQTCAHIEHSLWAYFYYEHTVHPLSKSDEDRIMDLRLQTSSLLKALEEYIPKVADSSEAAMLADLVKEIRDGLQTRHHVIHGALQFDGESGGYTLFHHWKPDRKKNEYLNYSEPLPAAHLQVAMDHANSIFLRAHELFLRAKKRASGRAKE